MILRKTSIFPASKEVVCEKLKGFDSLAEVAHPYMSFSPVNEDNNFIWEGGKDYLFKIKLFTIIPFGVHKIRLIEVNEDRIYSNEGNKNVPIWNHEIILREISDNETEYSDIVEIHAGWKTFFVYLWANLFYAHRQRKWIKIFKRGE